MPPRNTERADQVEIRQRDYAFRLLSRHISRTQSFQENRFHAFIVLKPLISGIGRLIASGAE